ncbi:dihydrolipoyl dehydrogenase [Alkaliphilus hydrothermalis]|uniref:Dihydrolipoyl dehydrogenase n=1 Tax=Alkaliphilus hydrothermalis TaxID=1482730 RepID=A0ABS2NUW8_9FIRM|nr:dihydrolipoyl dehydrogenase [Alkaliphilus hydrothermalis]MBM7616374.1 dihydrolipoamide dehydrogenase [Alkaliphilus hydrothermalis]
MKQYDVTVIGAGPGGYVAAIKAAQMGAKTAIIEKEDVGGVCLNWGCIPTKTLLKSAKVYQNIMNSEKYGIDIIDKNVVSINWSNMLKRKDQVVKKLTGGVSFLLKKNNVDLYKGYGEIIDKNTIKVNDDTIKTRNLIIATGSSPRIPKIEGIEEAMEKGLVVTSKGILAIEEIPKELIIVGGGVVGVEFATLYNALGTKVTIFQRSDALLGNIDLDLRDTMTDILKRDGINVMYKTDVKKFDGNKVITSVDGTTREFTPDKVLLSIGRVANSKGLEKLGIELDKRGNVVTNERLETNIEGVYAVGDVNGKLMLAHVASAEGIVAVENIMGHISVLNYDKAPSCIYGFPEIGSAGLTEQVAREKGYDIIVSTFPLSANGKALAEGESDGFVKIIAEKSYGEVLGIHILAPNATDMIAEAVTTMEMEGTVHELAKAIHPHPTLSEIVMEAAHGAIDKPIHI